MAGALAEAGKWEDAEKFYREVLATRQATLGPAHVSSLTAAMNLATNLLSQGAINEGGELVTSTRVSMHKYLGEDHPGTKAIDHLAAQIAAIESSMHPDGSMPDDGGYDGAPGHPDSDGTLGRAYTSACTSCATANPRSSISFSGGNADLDDHCVSVLEPKDGCNTAGSASQAAGVGVRKCVLMGTAGCGKTAVGRHLAAAARDGSGEPLEFIEGDDLHPPANTAKMAKGIPLTDDDRLPWLDLISAALAAGPVDPENRLVVSCSALKRTYRDKIRDSVAAACVSTSPSSS